MSIVIVTDSAADIAQADIQKYNIQIVPSILIIEGKEQLDSGSFSREDYYNQLPSLNPAPSTAAPSAGAFEKLYQSLFDEGFDEIFSIHLSADLSGTYNSARIAAEKFEGKVVIFDSKHLSMALGYQGLAAAEVAKNGGSMAEVVSAATSVRERVSLVALLDTLDQLRRSGRASWMQANLGKMIKLKLMIGVIDGKISSVGKVRTRKKGIALFEDKLSSLGPLQNLSILHTNAWAEAEIIAKKFADQCKNPITIENVTPVVGTQVGLNAIGYAALKI